MERPRSARSSPDRGRGRDRGGAQGRRLGRPRTTTFGWGARLQGTVGDGGDAAQLAWCCAHRLLRVGPTQASGVGSAPRDDCRGEPGEGWSGGLCEALRGRARGGVAGAAAAGHWRRAWAWVGPDVGGSDAGLDALLGPGPGDPGRFLARARRMGFPERPSRRTDFSWRSLHVSRSARVSPSPGIGFVAVLRRCQRVAREGHSRGCPGRLRAGLRWPPAARAA